MGKIIAVAVADANADEVKEMTILLDRMKAKYGEHYRDMLDVLYQLTEPNEKK